MKKHLPFCLLVLAFIGCGFLNSLRAQTLGTVIFGNTTSESAHVLATDWSPETPGWVHSGEEVPRPPPVLGAAQKDNDIQVNRGK